MSRSLILHQRSALDLPATTFVESAARFGCDAVSLFACCPDIVLPGQRARLSYPAIGRDAVHDVRACLDACGVAADAIEYFPIVAGIDVNDYASSLALGALLGGKRAVTHIHDPDEARAAKAIAGLCALAAEYGMAVMVEFCAMTQGCRTIDAARRLVERVGRDDFGIGVDCLHLIRSGGTADDVAALDARFIHSGQICDAHGRHRSDSYPEEVGNRELPGRGDLPIAAILSAIPAATPIEVEVPSHRRLADGIDPIEHLGEAVAASRAVLATLTPTR